MTDADVSIESRDRRDCSQVVFPRHWAQVKLRRPASRLHPSRLTIESHGRQCELGSFLTEAERRGLALRLQRLVGRINESPSWRWLEPACSSQRRSLWKKSRRARMVRARAVRHVMMIRAKIAQLAKLATALALSLAGVLPAHAAEAAPTPAGASST